MILDTSVLVSIHLQEPGAELLLNRIRNERSVWVGAPTLFEAAMVLTYKRRADALELLEVSLASLHIKVIPFSEAHYRAASSAFLRFGKGRHAAALNFGDCLTYAVAELSQQALLFIGNDFSLTDVRRA